MLRGKRIPIPEHGQENVEKLSGCRDHGVGERAELPDGLEDEELTNRSADAEEQHIQCSLLMLHAEANHLGARAAEDKKEGCVVQGTPEIHPAHCHKAGGAFVLRMNLVLSCIGVAIKDKVDRAKAVAQGRIGVRELL